MTNSSKYPCSVTARVVFTVEMPAGSNWGTQCTVEQIHKQAGQETKNHLENILRKHGGKIIGEPKVIAVLVEKT